MMIFSILSIVISRAIARSQLGFGFATIRDDELRRKPPASPPCGLN